jgi:hypothetical protein
LVNLLTISKQFKLYFFFQVIPDDEVGNVASIVDEKVAPVGFMSKTQINNLVNSVLQKQNCDLS